MKNFTKGVKTKVKNLLFGQMLFVATAFALMVAASYIIVSGVERKHLKEKVGDAISYTEANIRNDMLEPEAILGEVAETIRDIILHGDGIDRVIEFIHYISIYVQSDARRMIGDIGFYGVFDIYGGKFLSASDNWTPPELYDPASRPWYAAAVNAAGGVAVTEPYIETYSHEKSITFSRCIFDENNNPLGIVCLNIKLDRIRQYAVNTRFAENGYGFLLSRDMEIIAHPEPSVLGLKIHEMKGGIAGYENELKRNGYISEAITTNYQNIKSIVFIKRLQNGWYMGVVTPKDKYYKGTRNLAMMLVSLGTVLAAILIVILARISAEKNKADERMRLIFDFMPLGANIHNKNFDFFDCNKSALNLFGLTNKQEYYEKFDRLTPVYQPNGELSSLKQAENTKKAFDEGCLRFEWMHQKLNGEPIPCEITLVRVMQNNEYVLAAFMRDLREIKEADERIQIMLDATPIGASFWSRDFTVIDCNQEILRLFEAPSKQEYLSRFFDFSPEYQPDGKTSRVKAMELIRKAFEEDYLRFEWMHQKLNGEPIPSEVTLIRVKYKNGFIVVGYTRDLREQKAMIAEIHKGSEKSRAMAHWYSSILNAIPLPISVTNADKKWTFINSAVERYLEITHEDAIGKPCSNWNSHICNTDDCGIACVKRGKKQTYFSNGDSSYQVDVSILKDMNGSTMGYIEVVQDITNLKILAKKQADADAANLAKSAFLAKISHEIRTPMNAILGITEIQLQDETLPLETQEALDEIYNSGYLLLGIINDILDLSKIEAGKLELTPVKYDFPSLINDTVHLNVMRYESKPIEFKLLLDENIPMTLFGDDLRIKQILNNLLSNAFKYTEAGEVSLSVALEPPHGDDLRITLIFKVSDTGQGMTGEQLDKLFEEYTRFNTEANRTTVGTGLGMNISRYLVQIMNGEITVESELGKGSVFTVRLPQGIVEGSNVLGKELVENLKLSRPEKTLRMKKALQILREYMPYGRVLIVDDVETNLYVAKGLLAPYGLSIETAESGFKAIEKIGGGMTYDIVFMDHFMPKMDGMEAARIMRQMGYTKPIIALTANALSGQSEMFLANGFDGFISKPIDIRQMNVILNKFVRDKYPSEIIESARRLKNTLDQGFSDSKANRISDDESPSAGNELVKIFKRDAEKAVRALKTIYKKRNNFTDKDIQSYIINVHSMKSALANIGENALSDIAMKLEKAGRERDITVINNETPDFIRLLMTVIEKKQPEKIDETNVECTEKDKAYLSEKLAIINSACEEYDKKTIKKTLALLTHKTWPHSVNELLDTITEHLLHSAFAEIAGLIENYSKK